MLQQEVPFSEIVQELEAGRSNVRRNDEVYKISNRILLVHQTGQRTELDYWRIVGPDNKMIRDKVVQKLHSIPYSAHPGIQRTVRKSQEIILLERNECKCKRIC